MKNIQCVLVAVAVSMAAMMATAAPIHDDGWRFVLRPVAKAQVHAGAEADQALGGADPLWVKRGATTDDVSYVLLQYDLSELPLTNTAHAAIFYQGEAQGEGMNPSMTMYGLDNDWAQDTVTLNTLPQRRERIVITTVRDDIPLSVTFYLTDYVRAHFNEGRISLLIEMRSEPGFSKPISFNGEPALIVIKAQNPPFNFREIMQPIWKGTRLYNDILAPTSYEGEAARADLAFEPKEIIRVMDYGLETSYEQGKDYVIEGRTLRLTPDSIIPYQKVEDLYQEGDNLPSHFLKLLDGRSVMVNSTLMNKSQIAVTYDRAEPWTGPVPEKAVAQLPRTLTKLEKGEPVKVVLFGDSISVGGESSAKNNRSPYMPVWSDLVAAQLRQHYSGPVDWINPSLGGTISRWGVKTVNGLAAFEKPDLAIIAFGMNDGNWMSVEEFMSNTQQMMDAFRAQNPDVEFILIAPILPNPLWRDLTLMEGYREATLALQGPGLAVADVWDMHKYLLERKTYWDISSNHLNHPNDFMVRVYAQIVSTLLGAYE